MQEAQLSASARGRLSLEAPINPYSLHDANGACSMQHTTYSMQHTHIMHYAARSIGAHSAARTGHAPRASSVAQTEWGCPWSSPAFASTRAIHATLAVPCGIPCRVEYHTGCGMVGYSPAPLLRLELSLRRFAVLQHVTEPLCETHSIGSLTRQRTRHGTALHEALTHDSRARRAHCTKRPTLRVSQRTIA